jgi:hypothetical protein
MESCKHYWMNPHGIIAGEKEEDVVIVRYCSECGKKQMATIRGKDWKKATGAYLLPEHYEEGEG